MPFSHGKDGGVCVFVCFLRHRMFSHHPVGEGLAPPAWFRKAFILRGGFRPAGRPPLPAAAKEAKRRRGCPAVASRLQRSHSRTPFTGVTPTPFRRSSGQPWQRVQNRGGAPDGAVSINKGRADLGSAPTAASENYKKENNGRGEPLPYGVSGKRKQNRGGTGKQKGRSPRTSRGFVLFILIARVCALLSPAHTPAGRPAPPWTWGE